MHMYAHAYDESSWGHDPTGTSRQADLVRLVAGFASPLVR